jgi:hypothetical protein
MNRRTRIRHFAEGFLSAFNLFPNIPDTKTRIDRRSDGEALLGDWYKVGDDIRAAMDEVRRNGSQRAQTAHRRAAGSAALTPSSQTDSG